MGNKYLITGITGFAGPHLAKTLLTQGHEVWGLVRQGGSETTIKDTLSPEEYSQMHFLYSGIEDREKIGQALKQNPFTGIFHLAAQTHMPTALKDPSSTFRTNTMGTINLISAIQESQPNCRFLFVSSGAVYGRNTGRLDEKVPMTPVEPYGVSKAAAEIYIQERTSSGLQAFIARPFSHTGPRRGKNFSIASDAVQIAQIKQGLQGPIIKIGNIDSQRTVMDVRDCVEAYRLMMDGAKPGQVYNIGGTDLYSMRQLIEEMLNLSGVEARLEVDTALLRPVDVSVQIPDTTKIRTDLGWNQKIPIGKTLLDLLNFHGARI